MSDTEKTDAVRQKEESSDSPSMVETKEMEDETKEVKDDEKMEEDKPVVTPSPKKSPKKKRVEEEEEEEELPLGLLERPVVIESGKREKRKVERLAMTMTFTPQQKKKVDVPEGTGAKLGECPRIEYKISHTKTADLKSLHRILYMRKGSTVEIRKNIRQFCGFTFAKEDKEYEKRLAVIGKLTLPVLKSICDVLDIEKTGLKKDALVQRVMDFLMLPAESGKKVPVSKKRGRASKGDKKEKGVKRKRSEKDTKKKKKSKEDIESDEADDLDDEDELEENDKEEEEEDVEEEDGDVDEEEEEEDESEEEAPKKKKAKVEPPKKPKKESEEKKEKKENDKKAEKKEKPAKKPEKKETKKKKEDDDDDDDSDDETLASKKSGPPNNDELRDVVKKILDGANLEEVTMKTVVKQVYAKYPDFDLSDKKEFIKSTVKQLIS